MRIQAEAAWAGRTLQACVVGGDPFTVVFDAQAQADVTPEQAAHLQRFAGLRVTVVPESVDPEAAPAAPEAAAATGSASDASAPPAEAASPAARRRRKTL